MLEKSAKTGLAVSAGHVPTFAFVASTFGLMKAEGNNFLYYRLLCRASSRSGSNYSIGLQYILQYGLLEKCWKAAERDKATNRQALRSDSSEISSGRSVICDRDRGRREKDRRLPCLPYLKLANIWFTRPRPTLLVETAFETLA